MDTEILELLFYGLREKVEEYIEGNPHSGTRLFKFGKFMPCNFSRRSLYFIPEGGLAEELYYDDEWSKGLGELGEEFGISLQLPYWAYYD